MDVNVLNPWSGYMRAVYGGRKGVEPLGTVVFEEIQACTAF
jgi:hypothetical protein